MGRRKNKWFKKTINFYRYIFKFEVPFNVLIDGNFVGVSMQKKFDMKELLMKTLAENVRLILTSCVCMELKEIEAKLPGITAAVLKYKIEECKHPRMEPINCIKSYIGKKNHGKYFVATQDPYLRSQLRKIPGVPLLFFDQNMLLVDKVSAASHEASERREGLKEDPQIKEKKELIIKKDEAKEFMIEEFKKTKHYKEKMEQYKLNKLMGKIRRKAKGPNPLSVKKKQFYYQQRAINIEAMNTKQIQTEDILNNDKEKEVSEIKQEERFLQKKRHRSRKKK